MGLESATYINELNPAWPLNDDLIREADDHMRLIKQTLQNTFANVTGAVTATEAELNLLSGVTALPAIGGLNTHVQFNSGGNFQGSTNLTFDGTTLSPAAISVAGLSTINDLQMQDYLTQYAGGSPADGEIMTWVTANGRAEFQALAASVNSVSGGTNINVSGPASDPVVNLDAAVTGLSVNGVTLSNAGVATNYLDETGSYSAPAGGGGSPLTTKGDLFTFDSGDQRLAVGADGTFLTADSAEATGLKWEAVNQLGAFTENSDNSIFSAGAGAALAAGGTYNFLALDGAGNSLTTGDNNVFIGQNAGTTLTATSGNIAIGFEAYDSGFGTENIAIGQSAGDKLSNGSFNTIIGGLSGRSINSGTYCVVIGHGAMGDSGNTAFGDNTIAIGRNSCEALSLGESNLGIGLNALVLNASGDRNIAIGVDTDGSLGKVTSGDHNIGIGVSAGFQWTAGSSRNVAIGYKAGPTAGTTESDQFYLANAAGVPLMGGDFSTGIVRLSGAIRLTERADHIDAPSSGFGELWLRNDGKLIFTDDAGTDSVLN